jgi:cytochrome c oxidase subunit IV
MSSDSTHGHEEGSNPKTIWKTFWILLAITVGEILYAVLLSSKVGKLPSNILYAVLSFMKAGYIISEFMHMKYEVKNLIRTVGLPCLLLIWLIAAFIMEGNSWKRMMNKPMPLGAEMEQVEAAPHSAK